MNKKTFEINGLSLLTGGSYHDLSGRKGIISLRNKLREIYEEVRSLEYKHQAFGEKRKDICFYHEMDFIKRNDTVSAFYVFRALLDDGDKINWFVTYPVGSEHYYVVAYLSGTLVKGTDLIFDKEETREIVNQLKEALSWDKEFIAPDIGKGDSFEELGFTGGEVKKLNNKLQKKCKLYDFKYYPPLIPKGFILSVIFILFFSTVYFAYEQYQKQLEEEQRQALLREELEWKGRRLAELKIKSGELEVPWANQPKVMDFYQQCLHSLPNEMLTIVGWKYSSFTCSLGSQPSGEINLTRGDASILTLKKKYPDIIVGDNGDDAVYRFTLKGLNANKQDNNLLDVQFFREEFNDTLRYLGYKGPLAFTRYTLQMYEDGSIATIADNAQEQTTEKTVIASKSFNKVVLEFNSQSIKSSYKDFLKALDVIPGVVLTKIRRNLNGIVEYEVVIYANT